MASDLPLSDAHGALISSLAYNFYPTEVLAECLRYDYAAILTLVLLNKRRENTAGCETGAVKCVDEFGFSGLLTAETHISAARLIVSRVGDAGNLFISVHRGDLYLTS